MSFKLPIIAAALSALALGASACGGSQGGGGQQTSPQPSQEQTQQGPTPVAEVQNLSGKSTAVEFDESFVEALGSLSVMPGVAGAAKFEEGTATFPITGGNVTYFEPGSTSPFVRGMIEHDGSGLTLTKGDTEVELKDFVVNPGNSMLTGTVTANGEVAASDTPLFFLDGSTLEPLKTSGDEAILQGTTVELTSEAAKLLNKTFETDALSQDTKVGTAKITLDTQ